MLQNMGVLCFYFLSFYNFLLFKGIRHVEGEMSAKPPQGLLPRYGHSLLDEARAEIRNL